MALLFAMAVAISMPSDAGVSVAALERDGRNLLTAIDFSPDRDALEGALGANAESVLTAAAMGADEPDPGVRLRAIRALGLYPTDLVRAGLAEVLQRHASALGTDALYVRAAVEALGAIGNPADVQVLVPFLQLEASLDVRAGAAEALGNLGSALAIEPLRARLVREPSPQVRLAISDALRALGSAN